MTFSRADAWIWDFWIAEDDGTFHLFYLHAPRSLGDESLRHRNARIGHAVSRDLMEWDDLGEVLRPGGADDVDASATWTGSVVRGDDGLWHMFYTGSRFLAADSGVNVESITSATSTDLHVWQKTDLVISADPRWYETLDDATWREEAWRDPWVQRSADGSSWEMLITARANPRRAPGSDAGVIGRAISADLVTWSVEPPDSRPGAGFLHLEVPQVSWIDGRQVLLFSCDTNDLADSRRDRDESGGIFAVVVGDDDLLLPTERAGRLTSSALYAGKLVEREAGSWVLLAFENAGGDGEFVGRLADPIPVSWADDGALRLAVDVVL